MREEMAQERRLLNAKISETDAAKAEAARAGAELNRTKQALLDLQAHSGQQMQALSDSLRAEKLSDSNLTEMLAQARAAQKRDVANLEAKLAAGDSQRSAETSKLQAEVSQEEAAAKAEKATGAARLQKIRDVLRDALAVPVAVPSPFRNSSAKLTLARVANATLSVEDTVDDNLEHTAATLSHQDRVLNWAFRKLDSEGKELRTLNISKVASETKAGVLEQELAASFARENATTATLAATKASLAAAEAGDAKDRVASESELADAQERLQKVHALVAQAGAD